MHKFDQMTLKIDNINLSFEENVNFFIFLKKYTSIEMKMYLYTPSSFYHLAFWDPIRTTKKSIFPVNSREFPGSREMQIFFPLSREIEKPVSRSTLLVLTNALSSPCRRSWRPRWRWRRCPGWWWWRSPGCDAP